MTVRPPRALSSQPNTRPDLVAVFQHEARAEMAATLADVARRFEAALEQLKRHEAGEGAETSRAALVDEAARALFALLVQRDVLGLRGAERLIRDYAVPAAVLARVGAVR